MNTSDEFLKSCVGKYYDSDIALIKIISFDETADEEYKLYGEFVDLGDVVSIYRTQVPVWDVQGEAISEVRYETFKNKVLKNLGLKLIGVRE